VGESVLGDSLPAAARVAPGDLVSLQACLLAWIHTRLNVPLERIDPDKPIALYGLNSMRAVELQQFFLDKFGINFPPYLFFERITVSQVVETASKLIADQEKK
jgi:acyl carrier protein